MEQLSRQLQTERNSLLQELKKYKEPASEEKSEKPDAAVPEPNGHPEVLEAEKVPEVADKAPEVAEKVPEVAEKAPEVAEATDPAGEPPVPAN